VAQAACTQPRSSRLKRALEVRLPLIGAWACVSSSLVSDHPINDNSPVKPDKNMTFELTNRQGAVLITNHSTYREDIENELEFKLYIKENYESWVAFAREKGHGENIRPVLVTGVDLTKGFAAFAYSDNRTRMQCEFSVGAATVDSVCSPAWGSWHTPGLVHNNCGSTSTSTYSRTQRIQGTDGSSVPKSKIPGDHDQCVFIRYYTIRKKLFIPLLKARAGPHQLPKGDFENDDAEVVMVEVSEDDDDFADIDYLETGPHVIHNVPTVSPDHYPPLPLLIEIDQG
jgi:hypothetical protein